MNDTTRLVGRVAAWTTAALLGAALLSGYAQAQSGSGAPAAQPQAGASAEPSATPRPSRSPGARPTDRPKRPEGERRENRRRAPGRIGPRVLHGETVVATDQGNVTHVVQRGVVTAISGSSFTVRSADGFTLTWSRNADTKVRTAPKDQQQRALRVGDDVMSHGVRNGSSVLARQVRLVPEKAASDNDDDSQPA